MTLTESGELLLVRVGTLETDLRDLLELDPAHIAALALNALHSYDRGEEQCFNAAFEKPSVDPVVAEFSKQAHILFRKHVELDQLSLTHDWTPQKLVGSTSLYGRASFTSSGRLQTAEYKGYNWGANVPQHLR